MQPYEARQRESGIAAYEIGETWIKVRFEDGGCYLYNGSAPGLLHVRAMSRLAEAGDGLNTYINRHVRMNYARKLA